MKALLSALLVLATSTAFAEEGVRVVDLESPPSINAPYQERLDYCLAAVAAVLSATPDKVPETEDDQSRVGANGMFRIEVDDCIREPAFYAISRGLIGQSVG